MDGSSTEDYGTGGMSSPTEGISFGQRCQSVDSLAEWRSSGQLENGTPSTSPPYWDTDDDDDDCGPRPSELYGKFTWKIENYSQINKRELRSNAFEVGGYKWYILIYPQGCDVCNHLSLFLCVANHDKLLPGWSHFAQFTIAVVNKDPKKSKFSDTLHRFWKKEHDWGWKKFMEVSKVDDGFVNSETLVIKAQVQVIREKAHRPFRCLDCQYRRELVRVYLSNVEQICRRFFEDRKNKLSKLIEDKVRWSSFCVFWLGIDQNSRRRISRDKLDTILRVVVKHFFVEKEVTSTLVMDSLYSGLKALECQSKIKKEKPSLKMEESPVPMVRVDKDMFVLADDVVLLLERVALEPLPAMSLPPKDDKISQNRTKEGSSADDFKDSIEHDERRLTELGRKTVEIFVLAHIFSTRIEVAYQEAVSLKRQEELIREEEAAGQVEHELKAKRAATEKDKRTKKKQGKQKRNNRKSKEKHRDLKSEQSFNDKKQDGKSLNEIASGELLSFKNGNIMNERMDTPEDASDVSYNGDDVAEPLYPDLEYRDSTLINWDTDVPELHPSMEATASEISNYRPEKANPGMDDSSSTCSTDSVPSVVSNGTYKGNSLIISNIQTSPNRGKNHGGKHTQSHPAEIPDGCLSTCFEVEGDALSLKRSVQLHDSHLLEKQQAAAAAAILLMKTSKDQGSPDRARKTTGTNNEMASSIALPAPIKELASSSLNAPKRSTAVSAKSLHSSTSRSEVQKLYTAPAAAKNIAISRPSSAPLIQVAPRPNAPAISSAVQVTPLLSRSASATARLTMDPSLSASSHHHHVPRSYRNAIIGKPPTTRKDQQTASTPGLTFGSVKPEALQHHEQPTSSCAEMAAAPTTNTGLCNSSLLCGIERESLSSSPHGVVDEFPHLDIINDLLNEEHSIMGAPSTSTQYYHPHHLHHHRHPYSRQYSFPGDAFSADLSTFDQAERYYGDGFSSMYGGSSGRVLEVLPDRHFDLSTAYVNCQMDCLIQNEWPYSHADISIINLGGADDGGYSYPHVSEFVNLGNGYGLYRP